MADFSQALSKRQHIAALPPAKTEVALAISGTTLCFGHLDDVTAPGLSHLKGVFHGRPVSTACCPLLASHFHTSKLSDGP